MHLIVLRQAVVLLQHLLLPGELLQQLSMRPLLLNEASALLLTQLTE
jgi:hypothetical protein